MSILNQQLIKRIISGLVISLLSFYIVYTGGYLFILYVILAALIALYEWIQLAFQTKRAAAYIFIGLVYIALSFGACILVREFYPVQYLLVFFFFVAFSDMGGYLFGRMIGGPKLLEAVSPKKTWAGFGGALILPALIGILFAWYEFESDIEFFILFGVLGCVLGLVGQAGDLFVSYIKRQAGAKDAGGIIPGHGGVLDRIDAMMLAMPVFFLFMIGFKNGFFF